MIELLSKYLEYAGGWTSTLSGFIILISMVALGYGAVLVRRRIATLESQVTNVCSDIKLALAECQIDSVTDKSFQSTLKLLCESYRVLCHTLAAGRRTLPKGLTELDDRFRTHRTDMHKENNERILRARARFNEVERQQKK